eukprot:GEMP01002281.1.p1 GENE.GEMP01002281.1~~GEMP01002281.1.p1  ORF type:complete len:998 (+),score=108.02 GEMP01002281.1:735-3728(+)
MCYVRTIKDPRSLKLLKSYKINACAGLCVFLLLLTYFIFIFINHQTAEGFVGHTCESDDDLRQLDIMFLVNNFAYGTMIAVFAWMAPSIAHRCGVKWKKEGTGEETWSIDMNEAAMSGAVVLALGLSLYVPTLVPFSEMEIFMTTLMFGTCCGATLYFSKSNRLTHECLCDLSAASFIRRCDTWVGTLQFHLPGVKAIMIDCFLYVPLPFSHSTWPSEFSSTWPSELKVLAWTDKLNDFIMYMTKEVRFTVLMFLLLVYCGWAMLSFILRLFPMKSYYLTEAYVTTSWFLYLPLVMISTRLILDGVKCRDGNLLLNDAPCDEQSEHLTIHILFMSCLIWFVSLASLHFTCIGRLTFESLIAENPTVSVRNSFLRMMTILVAGSKLGSLGSIALPIFEIVILALATAQQFYDPLLIGHARNSAIHAGTLAYILALFVSVLLHFFLKLSTPVLFIACIGCPPITFVLGYHVAYKRFANIDNEVQEQVRISRDIDFTLPELPPRLLGICFHAAPFKKFIRDNLDITQKPKTLAELFQTNVRIISQRTVSALSFAGRRFSSSRSIGSPVTPCAIVPEPSPRTSLMPPSKQPPEPRRSVLLELEPLPNSLLESPPNQQEEQLPNLQVSPRKLLLESPRELPQEPLETHDSCTSLALTHLASAISMDCGRRVLLRAPEFVTTMPHWLLSAHRSKAIKCVRAMAEMEALHQQLRAQVMHALLTVWRLVDGEDHALCAETIEQIRGMHKIIVTLGPIQQIRCITIPHRIVWLVPHAIFLNAGDPIDAILTFPPLHKLPHKGLPCDVPHLAIPFGDACFSRASSTSSAAACSDRIRSSIISENRSSLTSSLPMIKSPTASVTSLLASFNSPWNIRPFRMSQGSKTSSVSRKGSSRSIRSSAPRGSSFLGATAAMLAALTASLQSGKDGPRKANGPYILFRLPDNKNDTGSLPLADDEDGVPTHRLRQELTAFYAFHLRPHEAYMEDDTDERKETLNMEKNNVKAET